jgi:glyoxylase-like metal-dependent hydrolase (beta-lactamase superfamily II)
MERAGFTGEDGAQAPRSETIALNAGRLYALSNGYAVDGRVSWHPPQARGVAPMNCYLLREDDAALLIDTGLTNHEDALLQQLRERLLPEDTLSIFLLRQGEIDSCCNLGPIVSAFGVRDVYGQYDDSPGWADFRLRATRIAHQQALNEVTTTVVHGVDEVTVGASSRRILKTFRPGLRLLNTHWAYDEATKTLFTSDFFSYAYRSDPAAPWTVTSEDEGPGLDRVRDHLLATRYWWLAGARTDGLRRALAEPFERYDIETIAPAYGCLFVGSSVVERQYMIVDELLANGALSQAAESIGSEGVR